MNGPAVTTLTRHADAGTVRLGVCDVAELVLIGDRYGTPYDLLAAYLDVRPDRLRGIVARWRAAGYVATGASVLGRRVLADPDRPGCDRAALHPSLAPPPGWRTSKARLFAAFGLELIYNKRDHQVTIYATITPAPQPPWPPSSPTANHPPPPPTPAECAIPRNTPLVRASAWS